MSEQNTPSAPEIDLNAVRNANATNFQPAKKRKSGRFNFVEAETIALPSKGLLYTSATSDEDVLNGYIKMFPMTVKEEEILSTSRFLKSGAATRMVLDNCIASDIDAKDILLFDSNYLLFYLRSISYGDDYSFKLKCSNNACEKEFEHTVQISSLSFEELPEDVTEPIITKLPKSKYTVSLVLPRMYHSEEIYRRNANRKKSTSDADQRAVDNLLVTTIEIKNETGEQIERKYWEEFFESLPGIDRAALKDATDYSTGVDTLEDVECPYCGTSYSGSIPIGTEFFRF